MGCCWFEVGAEAAGARAGGVGIGRAVTNARVYVVDARGRLCGAGVAGELLVGGAGLARGYLNRPGLTAEKFVPDPFSAEPGARLYRTGDLWRGTSTTGDWSMWGGGTSRSRCAATGSSSGEVEAALSRHAGVRAAAVAAREEDGRRAAAGGLRRGRRGGRR